MKDQSTNDYRNCFQRFPDANLPGRTKYLEKFQGLLAGKLQEPFDVGNVMMGETNRTLNQNSDRREPGPGDRPIEITCRGSESEKLWPSR